MIRFEPSPESLRSLSQLNIKGDVNGFKIIDGTTSIEDTSSPTCESLTEAESLIGTCRRQCK